MTKLRIKRTRQWSGLFVSYDLLVNGISRFTIASGQQIELELEDGIYSLQVAGKISFSNFETFEASHGRFFHYEVGTDVDMFQTFISMGKYPVILLALYFIDRLINWDYFLLSAIMLLIVYRLVDKFFKNKQPQPQAEQEKYYIYLRQIK